MKWNSILLALSLVSTLSLAQAQEGDEEEREEEEAVARQLKLPADPGRESASPSSPLYRSPWA